MKASSAKKKGRLLQLWVAERISELTGYEHGKDKPIESRPMGQDGTDIRMEKAVLEEFPFSVECKNQETWQPHKWIEQAVKNQLKNTDWLLVCKRNRARPVIMMDAKAFFKLLNDAKGNTE